jgi:hypothetical protein
MDNITRARQFISMVREGRIDTSLFTEDPILQTVLGKSQGRETVLRTLVTRSPWIDYSRGTWSEPVVRGDEVLMKVTMPRDSAQGDATLLLHFRGQHIHTIQHQALWGRSAEPGDLRIPKLVRELLGNALKDKCPVVVAHVDPSGQPVQSFRGSTFVLSDNQLAIWVRNSAGSFIDAINANPKVSLVYRNGQTFALYNMRGRARVVEEESTRQLVYQAIVEPERNHDFARSGAAVVIDLDHIEGWSGYGPDGRLDPINLRRKV